MGTLLCWDWDFRNWSMTMTFPVLVLSFNSSSKISKQILLCVICFKQLFCVCNNWNHLTRTLLFIILWIAVCVFIDLKEQCLPFWCFQGMRLTIDKFLNYDIILFWYKTAKPLMVTLGLRSCWLCPAVWLKTLILSIKRVSIFSQALNHASFNKWWFSSCWTTVLALSFSSIDNAT